MMARINSLKSDPRTGSAMVMMLWISLALATIAGLIVSNTLTSSIVVSKEVDKELAWQASEAGVYKAVFELAQQTSNWAPSIDRYYWQFDDRQIRIKITAPAGKVDINFAPPPVMANLLEALGASRERSNTLADAIADWRDEDDLRRINGAERSEYLLESRKEGPANRHFQNTKELVNVLGFTKQEALCAAKVVTIFSRSQSVDLSLAEGVSRRAFGLADRLVNTSRPAFSAFGKVVEIQVDTQIGKKRAARIDAVVRLSGDHENPLWIHSWRRKIVNIDTNGWNDLDKTTDISVCFDNSY